MAICDAREARFDLSHLHRQHRAADYDSPIAPNDTGVRPGSAGPPPRNEHGDASNFAATFDVDGASTGDSLGQTTIVERDMGPPAHSNGCTLAGEFGSGPEENRPPTQYQPTYPDGHDQSRRARHLEQHQIDRQDTVQESTIHSREIDEGRSGYYPGVAVSTALESSNSNPENSVSQQQQVDLQCIPDGNLHHPLEPQQDTVVPASVISDAPANNAPVTDVQANVRVKEEPAGDEWRSWKIGIPWLSFLVAIDLLFIATILILDFISRRQFGFVDIGIAPSFLTYDKAVEQAIWSQGILYTAVPAFIMTMFQTAWNAAVSGFVKRQPYVELKKAGGERSEKTLMLEYTEPYIFSIFAAVKNEHHLLAACMLSSVALVFLVVPLTSFLFTTRDFTLNSTFPISIENQFNTSILGNFTEMPSLRFMETAAAIHIQNASRPPWMTETYAIPASVPLTDVGNGNITYESSAYSAKADCVYLGEEAYRKRVLLPGDTGIPAISIIISANDRGCPISSALNIWTNPESPDRFLHSWTTTTCPAHAGWSRFSFLTARVTEDQLLADFSLVSCMTTYYNTTGNLTVNWLEDNTTPPGIRTFNPISKSESKSDTIWLYFEWGMQAAGCYDTSMEIESNEFGRQVYRMAKMRNSTSPLLPGVIIDAAQTLFTTMYAVFASSNLLQPTDKPIQQLGMMSVQRTRLVVVPAVAYPVVSILFIVLGLAVALFIYARQESILKEEPIGMLATAAILHGSVDVDLAITKLLADPRYPNRPNTIAQGDAHFNALLWRYENGTILSDPRHLGILGN